MTLLVKAIICEKCGSPLKSKESDLLMKCQSCDQTMEFLDTHVCLVPVKILESQNSENETIFIPFWKISAKISVTHERSTGIGLSKSPIRGEYTFYVCAADIGMKLSSKLNYTLSMNPPKANYVSSFGKSKHLPAIKTSVSAEKNAEFIFLKHEVNLSGTLQEIEYEFTVLGHEAVYIPFIKSGDVYSPAF